eukprot:4915316-Pyramimonas_sp.AAC.2
MKAKVSICLPICLRKLFPTSFFDVCARAALIVHVTSTARVSQIRVLSDQMVYFVAGKNKGTLSFILHFDAASAAGVTPAAAPAAPQLAPSQQKQMVCVARTLARVPGNPCCYRFQNHLKRCFRESLGVSESRTFHAM